MSRLINSDWFRPRFGSGVCRFLPPDPDAAGRVHPAGSGDSVQQREGAGPAEPAGQIHEKRRYADLRLHCNQLKKKNATNWPSADQNRDSNSLNVAAAAATRVVLNLILLRCE